eukprot:TRINITY_DN55927_c0_g1_i1.p2 TRINITY_DN55927_c0_g1~~TRINITY_DN55927_c0_g1_i1.p2  ORF type:complete len:103 (+),score=8.70 TRINITY_DN55927_c0_g1_i1:378-686(+)
MNTPSGDMVNELGHSSCHKKWPHNWTSSTLDHAKADPPYARKKTATQVDRKLAVANPCIALKPTTRNAATPKTRNDWEKAIKPMKSMIPFRKTERHESTELT